MKTILSYSGGKDSTALLIRLHELNQAPDEVHFADTGLEFPEIYEYLNKIEEYTGQTIKRIKPKKSWDELFYTKITRGDYEGEIRGFPYVITPCWAQRDLKVRPMEKIQKKNAIILLGITFDEQHRIQKQENLRYPLIEWGWTEKKCKQYLREKNLLNPIYAKFKRTGCWLCPKQPKRNLYTLEREYPDLWERLKKYEEDCPHGFKPNMSLKDYENQQKLKK